MSATMNPSGPASCLSTSDGHAKTPAIQLPDGTVQHSSAQLRPTPPTANYRNGHVNLDTFSPVNENGSFEFDRVLKSGKVHRRVKHKHVGGTTMKNQNLSSVSTADLSSLGIPRLMETRVSCSPTKPPVRLQRRGSHQTPRFHYPLRSDGGRAGPIPSVVTATCLWDFLPIEELPFSSLVGKGCGGLGPAHLPGDSRRRRRRGAACHV